MSNLIRILLTGANGFIGEEIFGQLSEKSEKSEKSEESEKLEKSESIERIERPEGLEKPQTLPTKRFEIIRLGGPNSRLANVEKTEKTEKTGKNLKFEKNKKGNYYRADISDPSVIQPLSEIGKIEVLIHTAGLAHQFGKTVSGDFRRINAAGTENICQLAVKLGVRHLILTSSVAVYGPHGSALVDETFPCRPEGEYAESKLEAERKAIEICEKNNIALTILRLATVIGEGDRGNVGRLIRALDKGRFIWIGEGENKKSLIYKRDVGEAMIRLVEASPTGTGIYNLSAEPVRMKDLVGWITTFLDKKARKLKISPKPLRKIIDLNKKTISLKKIEGLARTLEKWLADDLYDAKRFSERFGFEARTSVAEAIENQVKYYLEQKTRKNEKKREKTSKTSKTRKREKIKK